jgi:hypothetical protein
VARHRDFDGLGRAFRLARAGVQARIVVDIGQILPLLGGEGFCRRTHAGHPIQLFMRASNTEARMNVFIFAGRVDVRYTAVMRYGVRQITAQRAHARAVAKVLCGNSRGSGDSLFATMHSPPPSQQRRHPFGRAPANSMRLFVSRGFAFSTAETTIVTRD